MLGSNGRHVCFQKILLILVLDEDISTYLIPFRVARFAFVLLMNLTLQVSQIQLRQHISRWIIIFPPLGAGGHVPPLNVFAAYDVCFAREKVEKEKLFSCVVYSRVAKLQWKLMKQFFRQIDGLTGTNMFANFWEDWLLLTKPFLIICTINAKQLCVSIYRPQMYCDFCVDNWLYWNFF